MDKPKLKCWKMEEAEDAKRKLQKTWIFLKYIIEGKYFNSKESEMLKQIADRTVVPIKYLKKKIVGIGHLHLNLIWNTQILDGMDVFLSDLLF